MDMKDKQIIRELAKQYMQMACSEKQQKMNQRMKANNDLVVGRPPVLIDEIPWYQINIDDELTCVCQDERTRELEFFFRSALYRWKHFWADTLFEPFYRVRRAYDSTGIGISRKEKILRTDALNEVVSHSFEDVLEDEEVLDQMTIPEFTLRPDVDEENMNFYGDLLGDVMPVKLCGHSHLSFMPWDDIAFLRGVQPILMDLYERPEYLHRIMERFCEAETAKLDFIEANSVVDSSPVDIHCTPGMISGLADDGWKATWYRGAAQPFSSVSPSMTEEFEIRYIKPIAERFAYTYYGCCEPLDRKIDLIKQIRNLRKVGVSPWANVESSAEQLGKDYVYARKPNPAHVAIHTDPDVIRRETEETVRACLRYGCPCEFVLKDISTVSNRPENLIIWAQTVSDVLDQYY